MARSPGVELAGYLDTAVGVGEAARRYLDALRSVGIPTLARNVPLPGRDGAGTELAPGIQPAPGEVTCNLLCLNPEQMVPYLDGLDQSQIVGRSTIGVWSWEVDVLPPGWREAGARLAEVWTYSHFAAELIGAHVDVPVCAVPPPIYISAAPSRPPSVELPAGFRVLVMFDYFSTLERKNPLGAIAAFCRAFSPDDGAVLIVKSVNGCHRPERLAELQAAVGGRADIVMLDETMSGAERDALISACDCYLSLHRSEGHGLPLAEAMALGKPVVATAYGGNTEFMSEANSYLVAWRSSFVGQGIEHYPPGSRWAEPEIDHAARLLRTVFEDREGAMQRGQRAQADVRRLLSAQAVGEQMRQRLRSSQESIGKRGTRGLWNRIGQILASAGRLREGA
jgi:glycosyltransferase involved in cell wall biosynthesis